MTKMTKSVYVTKGDKGKFKVLVCFVQRGINFSDSRMANTEAKRLAKQEHIQDQDVHLIEEESVA